MLTNDLINIGQENTGMANFIKVFLRNGSENQKSVLLFLCRFWPKKMTRFVEVVKKMFFVYFKMKENYK